MEEQNINQQSVQLSEKVDSSEKRGVTKIDLKSHSIIMLMGPTNSGKTKFSDTVLTHAFGFFGSSYRFLSSDDFRRKLLQDYDADEYSYSMDEASEQAFKLLSAELEAYTSYPINCEFVVVDTRGFDARFREYVSKVARDNQYNLVGILFDYKTFDEYSLGAEDTRSLEIIRNDVSKFRRLVMPEVKSKDFSQLYRIRHKDDWEKTCCVTINNSMEYSLVGPIPVKEGGKLS